jgi:curved DNA-binding protein CbpA
MQATQALDYYEFLQISPNADSDTVHRVYRFLASRYHPDNPDSGDPEKFYLLKSAYDVLSDSAQRAKYDSARLRNEPEKQPMSTCVDFMDNLDGELNRRLAVLAVLYYRRRSNPYNPEVGLPEIEKRMGFPRDYLDFTTWYLTRKGYITKADNSDFSLTAEGVDFVESQRSHIPVLNKLLTSGNEAAVSAAAEAGIASLDTPITVPIPEAPATAEPAAESPSVDESATKRNRPAIPGLASITISEVMPKSLSAGDKVVMVGKAIFKDRRTNAKERRTGATDWRTTKVERRATARDRRA